MIKITDKITEDNYHILFSCADAQRTTPDEVIKIDGYLDLTGCTSLTSLPDNLSVTGDLYLTGCTSLTSLPDNLSVTGYLDLSGCTSLVSLPEHLKVGGNIYVDVDRVAEFKAMNKKFAKKIR